MYKKKSKKSKKSRKIIIPPVVVDYNLARRMQLSDKAARFQHHVWDMYADNALKAGTQARNLQIQHGILVESINRLPRAMQADAVAKVKEMERQMKEIKKTYPLIPRM